MPSSQDHHGLLEWALFPCPPPPPGNSQGREEKGPLRLECLLSFSAANRSP